MSRIKLTKSARPDKQDVFTIEKEEFIEFHRSENGVFSMEKGVRCRFFSRLARE